MASDLAWLPPKQTLTDKILARLATSSDASATLGIAQPSRIGLFRPIPDDGLAWLKAHFPGYFQGVDGEEIPLASHHFDFWDWVWSLRPGTRQTPFIAVWPRGAGKSTSCELACLAVGTFGLRRYGLYIASTQHQADDHVATVGAMFEKIGVERAVSQYGYSRGWRVNRLRTANGFILDALGLDKAIRGAKIEESRPDFHIYDDLDDTLDTPGTISKKIKAMTQKIIPGGTPSLSVIGVQNLPNRDGIFAQLVNGKADFLLDRKVSGPYPALIDFECELTPGEDGNPRYHITSGKPIWEGMGVQACEDLLNAIGLRSFRVECLHQTDALEGVLFQHEWINRLRVTSRPQIEYTVVGVDPPATTAGECGIVVMGLGPSYHLYVLDDMTISGSPNDWGSQVIAAYNRWQARCVVPEVNQGGDMVSSVIHNINPSIPLRPIWASQGKATRAEPVSAYMERGFIHHLGTFSALEHELTNWLPGDPSPNRLDAYVHAARSLLNRTPYGVDKKPAGVW